VVFLVRPEFLQAFGFDSPQTLVKRTEKMVSSVAMKKRNTAILGNKDIAHLFRPGRIVIQLMRPGREEFIVEMDEFLAVSRRNLVQVRDDPAGLLKFPVISQAQKTIIGSDVREKGKLAAA
jgi:hypothetical protein